jgi:putative membrane protein
MQFILVLSLLFALVVALFAMQNSSTIQVSFLTWEITTSVALVTLGAAALGALVVGLLGSVKQFGQGLKIRNLQGRIKRMQEEINSLQMVQREDGVMEEEGVKTDDDL